MATDTSIQERKFHSLFNHLDSDKNGSISWNDLQVPAERARHELGWVQDDPRFVMAVHLMKAGWDKALQTNDRDHTGSISFNEFVAFIFRTAVESATSGQLPSWALVSGDGITPNEYAIYLRAIGSDADPKSVFAKLDINKNGKISIDELHALLIQYLGSNDPNAPGNYLLTGKF